MIEEREGGREGKREVETANVILYGAERVEEQGAK